jgi:FkbM family methyltransferase
MKGAAHFITPGLCEFDEMGFVLHLLRPSDTMIDVGANVGAFTVLASAVKGARTIAFEPSPFTFGYLKRNVALNDITDRTRLVQCAVGRGPGELRLTNSLGTENYVSTDRNDTTAVSVPVRCLDHELANEKPTLIKVDVEGFEADVIAGALETLKKPSLMALIVERSGIGKRYGFDEAEVHAKIRAAGFSPFFYSAVTRELRPIDEAQEGNIVYVRAPDAVAARLREAARIEYRGVTF